MQTASKKVINGWAMYDWANSVYSLVITSTIFPAYYETVTKNNGSNEVIFLGRKFINSALYNYALGIAFLIVAVMSPILSSIADYKGNKKKFLRFFCFIGSVSCSLLYFFKGNNTLWIAITCSIVACIGFWSSLVFYNSYLPEIAAPEDRDSVSAKGFARGYIGSVILQLVCFIFVFKPGWFGMQHDATLPARFSFLLVGIWWFGFAQLTLFRMPKGVPAAFRPEHNLLTNGFIELKKVFIQLKDLLILKRFLLAFFFYNTGVQTIILVAALFGSKELKLPTDKLIITILIIQIVAIAGSYMMAKLSEKFGNFQTLLSVVIIWILVCISAYQIADISARGKDAEVYFYVLAAIVGLVMGGIQSLSRSTYSKLMPVTKDTTSFFSFYDVTEKIGIVIGMFSFGVIEEITGSMKNSVLVVMCFFIIGFVILYLTLKKEQQLQISTKPS
ncbi:MAG TPA: MFS transporter [Hanamia sp.]|nr:MFS transporter [Hanamia sp.]